MAGFRRRLFKEKESPWKYTQETWPSKHWKQSNFYSNLFSDTNWYQYTRADIFQRAMNDGYRERMMEEQREMRRERYEEERWRRWSAEREKKEAKELEERGRDKMKIVTLQKEMEEIRDELMAERERNVRERENRWSAEKEKKRKIGLNGVLKERRNMLSN